MLHMVTTPSARPHTMASLPAHPGPAETPSSTLLIAKNRQNVPCFSATLSATRPETLCSVSVSPLTRLKTFYLFYESDCRYKTDVRFPENLQRFALCCTLCCTDVALRCTETPQFFCTDVQCRALSRQTVAQGTCPTQGTRQAPKHWAKAFTRLHFWVWKHDMVLVPRGGSSLVRSSCRHLL